MLGMGGSASLATRIPLRDVQLFQAQGFHRVFGSSTARGDESGEECRLGEYGGDSGESWTSNERTPKRSPRIRPAAATEHAAPSAMPSAIMRPASLRMSS